MTPTPEALKHLFEHDTHTGGARDEDCEHCAAADLLPDLYEVWTSRSEGFTTLLAMQDGYGTPGYVPPQGPDWSGVRDSTPSAIRRMHRAVTA